MSADPAGWELINPMDEDGEPVPDGWPEGFGPGPRVGMRPGYSVIEATNWYSYVSNNPVKYVDPTGMILIIMGDEEFVEKVEKDLDIIRSKPNGKEMIEGLENSDNIHVIRESKGRNYTRFGKDYKEGVGSGSTIGYDPDKKTGGLNTEGSDKRPPFIGLAHELGHAEALDKGIQSTDRGTGEPGTTPPSEVHSLQRENEVRREHGIFERPSYYARKK